MKVLILGGSGMLGHKLWQTCAEHFETYATLRQTSDPVAYFTRAAPSCVVGQVSAQDFDSVARALATVRPDVVVNCIGIVKQAAAAKDPLSSIAINSLFPHRLAQLCRAAGSRLIHVSTDCVFSGALPEPARYSENDRPDAQDVYGRSKLLGEVLDPPGLTLRTSIIGRELERASGLLEWFAARAGERVHGFRRARFSGLTTSELSRLVGRILREHPDLTGLWHVAADPIDKHTLLRKLRDVLGVDCEIVPCDEPVINRALDATRFEAVTGYRAPTWDEMLEEYVTS